MLPIQNGLYKQVDLADQKVLNTLFYLYLCNLYLMTFCYSFQEKCFTFLAILLKILFIGNYPFNYLFILFSLMGIFIYINGPVCRRNVSILEKDLPIKTEYLISCRMR